LCCRIVTHNKRKYDCTKPFVVHADSLFYKLEFPIFFCNKK
jgi:hypothetical protein